MFKNKNILDKMVKQLYYVHMKNRKDLIKGTIKNFMRAGKLFARIEALPILVEEGLIVSTREAHTIQAVGEEGRIGVTLIADYFGVSKSAASQTVARLVERGFIKKRRAVHSAKEYELSLTDLGWKAFYAHEKYHGDDMIILVDALGAYSISMISDLSELLETLGNVMEKRLCDLSGT